METDPSAAAGDSGEGQGQANGVRTLCPSVLSGGHCPQSDKLIFSRRGDCSIVPDISRQVAVSVTGLESSNMPG